MEIVAGAGIFIGVVLFLASGASGDSLDRYCPKCGVSLATVFLLLFLPGLVAAAVLEGRLSNKTPDGGKVAKVEVTLLFTRNGQEEKLTAKTDSNGKFRFADLSRGERYRVNLEYEGAEYGAAAEFDKTQDNLQIEIPVYDSTSDPSSLRVKTHQIIVNPGENSLRVEESLQLANVGQRAFIGSRLADSQRRATIELTLPEGAAGYQYGNGLMECCVVAAAEGFVDTMDVKPGVREIVFSYTLPASSDPYRFIRRLDYATDALNVLAGGGLSAKSSGLEASEVVQIQGVSYLQLAGKNLARGTSMTVELAEFPGRPVSSRYLVFAAMALILIAAFAYVMVSRRKRYARTTASEEIQGGDYRGDLTQGELVMKQQTREERTHVRRRQRRMRTATFSVIGVLVLGAAGYLMFKAFWKPELPPMAGKVIDIAADMGGFTRKEVRVKAGEPVTVRLRSLDNSHHTDGGGKHQWAVDELGVNIIAPPEGSNYQTFTPAKPGTYTFYCDICCGGRANPTMSGRLIVV